MSSSTEDCILHAGDPVTLNMFCAGQVSLDMIVVCQVSLLSVLNLNCFTEHVLCEPIFLHMLDMFQVSLSSMCHKTSITEHFMCDSRLTYDCRFHDADVLAHTKALCVPNMISASHYIEDHGLLGNATHVFKHLRCGVLLPRQCCWDI